MSYSIKTGLGTLGVLAIMCMMSPKAGAQEKAAATAAKTEIVVGKVLKVAMEKATGKSSDRKKMQNNVVTQTWYYTPNTAPTGDEIYEVTNYTNADPENCGGGSSVPCEISFEENENYSTLEEYLQYQKDHNLPVNVVSNKNL